MSDDYTPIVRGGLKLKGSKPSGIKKKSKSKTSSSSSLAKIPSAAPTSSSQKEKRKDDDGEEEADEEKLRELDPRGDDGKTASERAYEEMRRKRVCFDLLLHFDERERRGEESIS